MQHGRLEATFERAGLEVFFVWVSLLRIAPLLLILSSSAALQQVVLVAAVLGPALVSSWKTSVAEIVIWKQL